MRSNRLVRLALPMCALIASVALGSCRSDGDVGSSGSTRPSGRALQPFALGRPDVVLLVTGGTNGLLEPCHCSGNLPGGYSRRNGVIGEYRGAFPRLLLVDTGDAFVPDRPASLRNHYVIRGYEMMGYDALVLADQEWAVPNYMLDALLERGPTAYLSTTVTSRALPDLATADVVRREWGPVKVAVVSDNHDWTFRFLPRWREGDLKFLAMAELARRVAALKRDGYVVVVSTHGDNLQLEETARACDADLFLRGNSRTSKSVVETVAGRPVVTVAGDRSLGAIALRVDRGRVVDLEYRLEAVDARWTSDQTLMKLYEEYLTEAMPEALRAPRKDGLAYVAPEACGACHPAATAKWEKTRHSHAYDSLVRVGRAGDPECVQCHTTGFGTKSGFTTPEATPRLASVSCQVCHPIDLDAHVGDASKRVDAVVPALCASCHTKVTDPTFDRAKRWEHATCSDGR